MKVLFAAVLMVFMAAATIAGAADVTTRGSALSWGGVFQAAEASRITLWDGGKFLAGVSSAQTGMFDVQTTRTMKSGGFLAWQSEGYRLDASLAPSLDGSVSAGVGAVIGPRPGELGTSYGVRLGAAWLGERFTVNPAIGSAGLAQVVTPSSDVNLSFTINHSLTPSLSIIGTAETRRNVGTIFGAGLGYRF